MAVLSPCDATLACVSPTLRSATFEWKRLGAGAAASIHTEVALVHIGSAPRRPATAVSFDDGIVNSTGRGLV